MKKNIQEEQDKKEYNIFTGIVALIIGLWLAIPSMLSIFNFSLNSVDFWLDCISIIFGIITALAGLKSFMNVKK